MIFHLANAPILVPSEGQLRRFLAIFARCLSHLSETAGYTTKKFSLHGTVYGGADAFDFNNISIDGIINLNMSVLVKNIIGWYISWHHSALTCMLPLNWPLAVVTGTVSV